MVQLQAVKQSNTKHDVKTQPMGNGITKAMVLRSSPAALAQLVDDIGASRSKTDAAHDSAGGK